MAVNRKQIYQEIEKEIGVVPTMLKAIPDETIELEWKLFKHVQLDEGPVPNKYKELIGLGIAAYSKCKYCIFFHTEAAKLAGATDAEIEDALHFAKSSAGWSTYISGMQIDFDEFKKEVRQVVDHVKKKRK